MLDLKVGAVLLFLLPGLCAFCALYGLFGSLVVDHALKRRGLALRSAFAPAPPDANSIKAVTFILLASLVVHGLTMIIVLVGLFVGRLLGEPFWLLDDPFTLAARSSFTLPQLAELLTIVLLQGLAAHVAVRFQLSRWSMRNALPRWLYGWTTDLANLLDDDDKVVLAVVLSTIDIARPPIGTEAAQPPLTVAYLGIVHDIGVAADGAVKRVNLLRCQRFLIDLTTPFDEMAPKPLADFAQFSIEAPQIRNVTFEVARDKTVTPIAPDILAEALRLRYQIGGLLPSDGGAPK